MGIIFNKGFAIVPNIIQVNPNITPTPTPTVTNTPIPSPTPTPTPLFDVLLMEDGFNLLQENNNKIIL